MRWFPAAIGLIAAVSFGAPALAARPVAGEPAPDFALRAADGEVHRLSEYRGEPVLLAFTTSRCGQCARQLQDFSEVAGPEPSGTFRVLAISLDGDEQTYREAARRHRFPVLDDGEKSVARLYDPPDLPFAVLIDAHGIVHQVYAKYRPSDRQRYAEDLLPLRADSDSPPLVSATSGVQP